MSEYVLAHRGDARERQRMELLDAYHGPLTLSQIDAGGIGPGWRCLEVGAGAGLMTRRLAERVRPSGRVVAIDLETSWLEPLRSDIVEVRRGDITTAALEPGGFDLVLAQMLLLHLADPGAVFRRLLAATRPGGHLIVHDADFSPVALLEATPAEAEGVAAMMEVMRAAGVDVAFGARLEAVAREQGAYVEHVESQPVVERGDDTAARITVITLERFREQAMRLGVSPEALDAAVTALHDPNRVFVAPTRWSVRCSPPAD
jgi:SAM-dependent methyltransferase